MGAYRGPSPSRPVPISHLPPLLHPSIPPSRRAMSGISFDGTCLKIPSIINPQPGPGALNRDTTSRAGLTIGATISIAYLVFFLSRSLDPVAVLPSRDCQDCPDCISSHQFCVRKCGFGGHFSASSETSTQPTNALLWCKNPVARCKAVQVAGLEQAHIPGGQERSSVAEARERLGAQGPGQEVRRRRFAETWEIGPLCKAISRASRPHHPADTVSTATFRSRSQTP